MKKLVNYFVLIGCLMIFFVSCKKESVIEEKQAEGQRSYQTEEIGNNEEEGIPNINWWFEEKCDFSCPLKGYRVRIMQKIDNGIPVPIYHYSYEPLIYIYLSETESNYGNASVTSYQFYSRKPANPGSSYNDRNGDPIVGDAYEYMLLPSLQTCINPWSTVDFTSSSNPCYFSISSILFTMNNSQNKPCSKKIDACSVGSPNFPVIINYVYGRSESYWDQPYLSQTTVYGWQCNELDRGFCHLNVTGLEPNDPNAGPMDMKLVDNIVHIMFWRDTELQEIEINETNNEINEEFKEMFGLSPEAVFMTGIYPIEFGELRIEIDNPE